MYIFISILLHLILFLLQIYIGFFMGITFFSDEIRTTEDEATRPQRHVDI